MNDQYELTVIISNYNQEKHIAETIDSVLSQRVNYPFQIIITDDFSCQDRSKDIIRDYEAKYDFIRAIFAKENKGYLTNILRAKERTKTKYFCLLDAEDYWTDRDFLQRAYDYLEEHEEYTIYEANVRVVPEDLDAMKDSGHPFISPRRLSGTYSKEMLLTNKPVPITQTTGMFFRNCIFSKGVPEIMKKAVGTRSERSFEGDTGRFMMHLKEGPAYYDKRIVGVYRLTRDGIWNKLTEAKKQIINARAFLDYYQYYGSDAAFFVNRAYALLQDYIAEKNNELAGFVKERELIDEYEYLMVNDVYRFCKEYKREIRTGKKGLKQKAKQIIGILRT